MSVRAKFYVTLLENPEGATAARVGLNAVCRGVENSMWAQATPAGSISMTVLNTPAYEQFEMGAEYEVTFTKVAKPMAGDGHPIKEVTAKDGRLVCETCGGQLGFSKEAVERQPHLASYSTQEARQEAEKRHEETFGKKVDEPA